MSISKIIIFYDDGTFREIKDECKTVFLPTIFPVDPVEPEDINNWTLCSKCGMKLDATMMYVCPQTNCPTGLGGVSCGTNNSIPRN